MTKKEREQLINYLKYNRENNLDYVLTDKDVDMILEALSADAVSKTELKEKMLKYGFTAPDMTVTEFVEDFESL